MEFQPSAKWLWYLPLERGWTEGINFIHVAAGYVTLTRLLILGICPGYNTLFIIQHPVLKATDAQRL